MLTKAIYYFIAGLIIPYVGTWFAGSYLLGSGNEPNFIPMQIASAFTVLLSIGLLYLSRVEKRAIVRYFCIVIAAVYAIMHLGIFLDQENPLFSMWFNSTYLLNILVGVTVGIVLLGKVSKLESEI